MTALSRAEIEPVRLIHKPKLPPVYEAVLDSLQNGSRTALEIQVRTRLRREMIYEALVWLEAQGKACLIARKNFTEWGAR